VVQVGLLETRPGIGSIVAVLPESSRQQRTQLLEQEIETLVVEAKRLGIELEEVQQAISAHWQNLGGEVSTSADSPTCDPHPGGIQK